ncbi:hypothetical protein L204_102735 [Cryptococcus depauperatus]|nr:hypothetical protein L204_00515 [Cryptococcus depauperatus CBS 7855]
MDEENISTDTFIFVVLRIVFFLVSRKFLHHTINPTLSRIAEPETLLPSTGIQRIPGNGQDTDYADETDDSHAAALSSYPSSPTPIAMPLASSSRDDSLSSNLPSVSGHNKDAIELQRLSQKLKDVGSGVGKKVLRLSHRRERASVAGTKGMEKTTRGLHRISRILFSVCFAESCNLLSLVVFHALNLFGSRARQVNFSISLHLILADILVVVPLVQCLLLTYRSRDSLSVSTSPSALSSISFTTRLLISLLPFLLYVFLFTRIPPYITAVSVTPPPEPLLPVNHQDSPTKATTLDETIVQWSTSGPEGWEQGGWLSPSLGRVVVLGVVVLGGLSGFGAVRSAWNFFEHHRAGSKTLTDNDLLQAERSLYRVRQDLVAKQDELDRFNEQLSEGPGGWMGKVFGEYNSQTTSLRAELKGLQVMESQVSRSLKAMKVCKRRQEFGETVRGQIYYLLGYVFALYCAARLLMCFPSLFYAPRTSKQASGKMAAEGKGNTNGDWISFFLALAISRLPKDLVDIDVSTWSRGISLILTGFLILSSLAQVMKSLSRILRLASKTIGAGFLLLTLGQLFSTYVISLLIQLRGSLPPSATVPVMNNSNHTATDPFQVLNVDSHDSLLATLPDFRVFGRLFDVVFILTATTAALYRYIAMKVAGADDSGNIYRS